MTGYAHDSMYQAAILQSIDLSKYDSVTFHTSGFSSLMCYMFLINKLHLYVPYMLRLSTEGVSKFYYYRRLIMFLNRIPLGIGKYVILLVDMISVLFNALKGYIYTVDDFVRLINYIDRSNEMDFTRRFKTNEKKVLQTLNVHVYNITLNRSEIIKGSHPLFKRYLLASLARLTFFEPIKIQMMSNECRCNDECINCNKIRNNNSIFINPEGQNICTCENISHRYNEFVDCDLNGPFSIENKLNNIDDNMKITNLILLSNCVKDQRILIIRKTNFLAKIMDLLKYTTQHKVDDVVDKICCEKNNQRIVCINYCINNNSEQNHTENKKYSSYTSYKDFNPALICDLKRSYDDGAMMRKLIGDSLTNSDKDKIYIECQTN